MANAPERGSVLLVEDDLDYSELLEEAFQKAGFRTFHADNGEKAMDLLRRQRVDLVVSDFIMPEINGLELCRRLTEDLQFAGVKMILYSCNTDNLFRRRAREMGALDYLAKSEDTEGLVQQICRLAGIEPEDALGAGISAEGTVGGALQAVSARASQLRVLFDNLADLIQIASLSDSQSPAARVAWEATQRSSGEMRRLLRELENLALDSPAPRQSEEDGARVEAQASSRVN
jgi:CheY-like chemotaxis protein